MKIEVFTQSSIRITSEHTILWFDPFRVDLDYHDADYIFLTHDHYDHFSPDDIAKVIKSTTVVVVPEPMEQAVRACVPDNTQLLLVKPGIVEEHGGHTFETVPAYNNLKPFHPKKAGWCGYIVHVEDKRIYVAGDTSLTPEARKVQCDIALVPIGGTYTMNARKAAELVNHLHPELAIPTHYGSIVGTPEDGEIFRENVKMPIRVELLMQGLKA